MKILDDVMDVKCEHLGVCVYLACGVCNVGRMPVLATSVQEQLETGSKSAADVGDQPSQVNDSRLSCFSWLVNIDYSETFTSSCETIANVSCGRMEPLNYIVNVATECDRMTRVLLHSVEPSILSILLPLACHIFSHWVMPKFHLFTIIVKMLINGFSGPFLTFPLAFFPYFLRKEIAL